MKFYQKIIFAVCLFIMSGVIAYIGTYLVDASMEKFGFQVWCVFSAILSLLGSFFMSLWAFDAL